MYALTQGQLENIMRHLSVAGTDAQKATLKRQAFTVAVLGKIFGGLAPHHLGGNNG